MWLLDDKRFGESPDYLDRSGEAGLTQTLKESWLNVNVITATLGTGSSWITRRDKQ